jgi:hypothetical protein
MEMEKKNIAILILAIALVASGVGNIIFLLPTPVVPEDKSLSYLVPVPVLQT